VHHCFLQESNNFKKKHLVRNETLKQETAANDEGRTELTTWAAWRHRELAASMSRNSDDTSGSAS